ncbi:glyoxalase [Pseudoxanthomonas sp. USHLN014]|uniref:glyoxalase n=1 Tax=Pseudoxanthomonas sp. USHLN014 TaxID=3081297 RepID=UPI00301CC757
MPPKATDLRPFVPCIDFALCKDFYASLGWETHEVSNGLALVCLGDAQHFYLQDYYRREVAENCMLHVTVEDAMGWYRHAATVVRERRFQAARVQPPQHQPYGALVTFLHDPSGVLLHLCQWA